MLPGNASAGFSPISSHKTFCLKASSRFCISLRPSTMSMFKDSAKLCDQSYQRVLANNHRCLRCVLNIAHLDREYASSSDCCRKVVQAVSSVLHKSVREPPCHIAIRGHCGPASFDLLFPTAAWMERLRWRFAGYERHLHILML